jgi:phosphoribosylanthranilate isomerase
MNISWKICGMREEKNIFSISNLKPNYMGFIFYPASKRFVGEEFIMPIIPNSIHKVGVFVNESVDKILSKIKKYELSTIQLHGEETVDFCKELASECSQSIVKAFGVNEEFDFSVLEPYVSFVNAFLLDTKGQERGGNGISFDWNILKEYKLNTPLWISGGIGLENIEELFTFIRNHPQLPIEVIDINSRFEDSPALKNLEKLKTFQSLLEQEKSHYL